MAFAIGFVSNVGRQHKNAGDETWDYCPDWEIKLQFSWC